MEVIKTIKPGRSGTKRFSQRYGDRLCAVRYRTSECGQKIYTTVEIIVDERSKPQPRISERAYQIRKGQEPVALKISYEEIDLRQLAKNAGARWSKTAKAWITRRHIAISLGLADRIVEGLVDRCTDLDTSFEV